MGRKNVEAEEYQMDALDQTCLAIGLGEEQCNLIRQAVQEICTKKGRKEREPTSYNIFVGECVKGKTGPVTERFKQCVLEWRTEKEKRSV